MKGLLSTLALLLVTAPAAAQFYNFSQWERLPKFARAIYISGAFDSLIIYGKDPKDAQMSSHYRACINNSKMDSAQLANNVLSYAHRHPEVRAQPVQVALAKYLFALCGKPPD